jgi:hypothetical protein
MYVYMYLYALQLRLGNGRGLRNLDEVQGRPGGAQHLVGEVQGRWVGMRLVCGWRAAGGAG